MPSYLLKMTVVLLCRILWNRKHTEKKAQKRKRWENKAGRFKTVQTIFVTERTRKLNMYLEEFIPSIWRKDREDYEPLSLRSFVSSVDRCFVDFHQRQFTWFTSFMIDLWELNLNLMNKKLSFTRIKSPYVYNRHFTPKSAHMIFTIS